jgi:hypothetical protein
LFVYESNVEVQEKHNIAESGYMVWRKQQSMISSRSYFAASIVGTKQNKLWATGGQTECVSSSNTIHEELLLSTELYHLDEDVWVEGPELDLTRGGHCMMRVSSFSLIPAK